MYSRLRISSLFTLLLYLIAPSYAVANCTQSGLTQHFRNWLDSSQYRHFSFAREDLNGGSFGGRCDDSRTQDSIQPVIFVHGSGDQALSGPLGGWAEARQKFIDLGYDPENLFATTYGTPGYFGAGENVNDSDTLNYLKNFISAVAQYSDSKKVDIIAHSFGVTLARGAIQLGHLGNDVDTFVGIAGANLGERQCLYPPMVFYPICGRTIGLHPQSLYLENLNSNPESEADYVFSVWSPLDEVIGYGCQVEPGINTCQIPRQNGEAVLPLSHLGLRDFTAEILVQMVVHHMSAGRNF